MALSAASAVSTAPAAASAKSQNQSILLLGESGSGKTETARLLIAYLRRRSRVVASLPEDDIPAGEDDFNSHDVASKEKGKKSSGDDSPSSSASSSSESEDSDVSNQHHEDAQRRRRLRTKRAVDRASEHKARKTVRDASLFGLKDLLSLFECFTHAATPRNPNSSRCGRFIRVQYAAKESLPALTTMNDYNDNDDDYGDGGDSSRPIASSSNQVEWLSVGASIDLFGLDLSRITCDTGSSSISSSSTNSNPSRGSHTGSGSGGDRGDINVIEQPHCSFHAFYALLEGAQPSLRQQLRLPDSPASSSSSTLSATNSSGSKSTKGGKSSSSKSGISKPDAQVANRSTQEKAFQVVNRALKRLSDSSISGSSGDDTIDSNGGQGNDSADASNVDAAATMGSSNDKEDSIRAEHASSIAWHVVAAVWHLGSIQIGEVDSEAGRIAKLHPHLDEQHSNNSNNNNGDDSDDDFGEENKDENYSSAGDSDGSGSGDDSAFSMPASASSKKNEAQERESSVQSKASLKAAAAILGISSDKLSQLLTEKKMGLSSGDAFTVIFHYFPLFALRKALPYVI